MKAVLFLVLLMASNLSMAQQQAFNFQGTWRFDKTQFKAKHYLMPFFVVNRAMKTRLVLADDYFAQYDDDREIIGVKRPLQITAQSDTEYALSRVDEGEEVNFFMQRREDGIYFVEGDDEYKLILVTDEPALR